MAWKASGTTRAFAKLVVDSGLVDEPVVRSRADDRAVHLGDTARDDDQEAVRGAALESPGRSRARGPRARSASRRTPVPDRPAPCDRSGSRWSSIRRRTGCAGCPRPCRRPPRSDVLEREVAGLLHVDGLVRVLHGLGHLPGGDVRRAVGHVDESAVLALLAGRLLARFGPALHELEVVAQHGARAGHQRRRGALPGDGHRLVDEVLGLVDGDPQVRERTAAGHGRRTVACRLGSRRRGHPGRRPPRRRGPRRPTRRRPPTADAQGAGRARREVLHQDEPPLRRLRATRGGAATAPTQDRRSEDQQRGGRAAHTAGRRRHRHRGHLLHLAPGDRAVAVPRRRDDLAGVRVDRGPAGGAARRRSAGRPPVVPPVVEPPVVVPPPEPPAPELPLDPPPDDPPPEPLPPDEPPDLLVPHCNGPALSHAGGNGAVLASVFVPSAEKVGLLHFLMSTLLRPRRPGCA